MVNEEAKYIVRIILQPSVETIHIQLKGKWLSGSRRQTVNLLAFVIAGSNPAFPKRYVM